MPCEGYAGYHLKTRAPYETLVARFIDDSERKREIEEFCRWLYFGPISERDYKTEIYVLFFRPQTNYYVRKRIVAQWIRAAAEENWVIPWSSPLKKPARTVRHWFETKQANKEDFGHIGKTPYKLSLAESDEKLQRQIRIMEHIRTHRTVPPDLALFLIDYPLFHRSQAYKKIKELLDENIVPETTLTNQT